MNKIILFLLPVLVANTAIAQKNQAVALLWKLKPGDSLAYTAVVEEHNGFEELGKAVFNKLIIDTALLAAHRTDSSLNDTLSQKILERNKIVSAFSQVTSTNEGMLSIKKNEKGLLAVIMSLKVKLHVPVVDTSSGPDTLIGNALKNFRNITEVMTPMVALNGTVDETGAVQSFYINPEQKNLLAELMELPHHPVKVGDSWSVDTHLLSMDRDFICDTSFKRNSVTLQELKKQGNETIAFINYAITEFAGGSMNYFNDGRKIFRKITCTGLGKFAVEKGEWVALEETVSTTDINLNQSQVSRKISLTRFK